MKKSVFEIDPVRDNVTNRIDRGSITRGRLEFNSGLVLQGTHHGDLHVRNGNLVIEEGGSVFGGHIVVERDLIVLGQLGSADESNAPTRTSCKGALHFGKTSVVYGQIECANTAIYEGAKLRGAQLLTGE